MERTASSFKLRANAPEGQKRFPINRQNPECIAMMEDFIKTKPELWNEDIGV